jgi:multiple sugar transport system permease protein
MNYVGRRISKAIKQILLYSVLGVVLVAFMIPTYWIVSTSLKVPKDIMAMPPRLVFAPTFANYAVTLLGKEDVTVTGGHATSDTAFPKYVLDSAVISLGATLLALLLGTPAAYALARMRFPGKRSLAYFTFLIRLLPSIGLIIPMYIMFSKLKLLDSYLGLILAYLTFNLSFVIWMMKSFIEELPIALEDAALVDGCTRLGLIVSIILPISLPGLGEGSHCGDLLFHWRQGDRLGEPRCGCNCYHRACIGHDPLGAAQSGQRTHHGSY